MNFVFICIFFSSLMTSIVLAKVYFYRFADMCRSSVRLYTPKSHEKKDNTPTMGGIFVLLAIIINSIVWSDSTNIYVGVLLITLIGFGCIGLYDDWGKIQHNRGLSICAKFFLQLLVATISILILTLYEPLSTVVAIPFIDIDIGIMYVPFAIFMLLAASNAVNLTDGLDGLVARLLIINFLTFSYIAYTALCYTTTVNPVVTKEIIYMGLIIAGSLSGFLYYNRHPARLFMGDVGSLAFGAALALFPIFLKQELLFIITGSIFVVETLSVAIQILGFRIWGVRVLKRAPLHHHFECIGWSESQVTRLFTYITLVLCIGVIVALYRY